MSIGRKVLSVMGIVFAGIMIATAVTLLCASDDDRTEILEALTPESVEEEHPRKIDWDSLPPEVVAWVEVPGTAIDEPIAQATPDAPNAYLYKDALGQDAYGTPYIDCDCSLETDFVMIYGHHMSDGSTFADYARFIDEGYARDHARIIVYERSGEVHELEAIAVDVVNASRERLSMPDPEGFPERVLACDLILDGGAESNQLWVFATCSYQTWNSRILVYATSVNARNRCFWQD